MQYAWECILILGRDFLSRPKKSSMMVLPTRHVDESAAMKPIVLMLLLCLTCEARAGERQGSTDMSNASELVAEGSALVVTGSLSALVASGTVVVDSIEAAGDASMIVLAGASDAAQATVRLSGRAARTASLAVGASVKVVAASTGYLLVSAGKVLAFIPNETGKALLHHSRAGERG
jgi:hypothetical protein